MGKIIRLTESELINTVKKIISEQNNMRNEMMIMGCVKGPSSEMNKDDWQVNWYKYSPILLNDLIDATGVFADLDWDEKKIADAFERSNSKEFDRTENILKCSKIFKPTDGSYLLTFLREAFTQSSIPFLPTTDLGDKEYKIKVQKKLKQWGKPFRI